MFLSFLLVESVVGEALGCRATGGEYSTRSRCFDNEGTRMLMREYFYGRTCANESYGYDLYNLNLCQWGETMECIEHNSVPGFAKHDGLMT